MNPCILGIGTAMPKLVIPQKTAAQMARRFAAGATDLIPALYRRTRVDRRGSVLLEESGGTLQQSFFQPPGTAGEMGPGTAERMERYAKEAPVLALAAAERAIQEASPAAPIAHLVTVSCTGFMAPGIDGTLIPRLGLPRTVTRTNVGFMGCHGALNGLRAASALVRSDPAKPALLCAVELCSIHFRYGSDPAKVLTNALFADGAAALVLGRPAEKHHDRWELASNGSCIFPDSADAMTWKIGDNGFEMTLSARTPGLIAAHLRPWLEEWLRDSNLTLRDIASWAIHPGGPRILSSVADALHLPEHAASASAKVLADCGNMSSPTILFILEDLRRRNASLPCVALGFGPGLAVEAALFR